MGDGEDVDEEGAENDSSIDEAHHVDAEMYGGSDLEHSNRDGDDAAEGDQEPLSNEDEALDEELNEDNQLEFSAFEQKERKRHNEVHRMEQERLVGSHWTMVGEVAGAARPRDSLLDENLDFEHAMNNPPVITPTFTAKLEDRVKRRIADRNFDDVQRRVPKTTSGDLASFRSKAEAAVQVDSTKSKLSLVDLYEKDYLEKLRLAQSKENPGAHAEPLTEVEKDELKAIHMWKRISQHLDALSNFYYTAPPVAEDVDARVRAVKDQIPAIALESVGMFNAISREQALAPQDLHRPRKRKLANASREEMNPAEKRALRRSIKQSTTAKRSFVERRKAKAQVQKR